MDFVSVCNGSERSHSIIAETLKRNLPISGHVFGRDFVAAYAASGVTDTHEAEENNLTSSIESISKLSSVSSVTSTIRVYI